MALMSGSHRDRPQGAHRGHAAVRLDQLCPGGEQATAKLGLLFGHQVEENVSARSQLTGNEMLDAAGSIQVPEGVAHEGLSGAVVGVQGRTKDDGHDDNSDLALCAPTVGQGRQADSAGHLGPAGSALRPRPSS